MKENHHNLKILVNHAIVFRGTPDEIERFLGVIARNLGDIRVVYSATSGGKLRIVEENRGGGSE